MYAKVLIQYEVKSLDHIFTYRIPSNLQGKVIVGITVIIPFSNKELNGLVLEITDEYNDEYALKDIIDIKSDEVILNKELMDIGLYLKKLTYCNLITAYKTMLPSSLKIDNKKKELKKIEYYAKLIVSKEYAKKYIDDNKRAFNQNEILKDLLEKEEIKCSLYSMSSINSLVNKNIIEKIEKQVYRINNFEFLEKDSFILTEEQQKTYDEIKNSINEYNTHLIFGVTASGKTEVYFRLIEEVLKAGKTAMFLVPEITLTSQMINRFYKRFGPIVAVYNSGLSHGEKYDEYLKMYRGEAHVVVGTRSAVFAPMNNLGIIIIDEEHSDNFKQDSNPRYNTIDIAKYRAKYNHIPLILGSATPQLESMARAEKGVYKLHKMTTRINNAKLPNVFSVDMSLEVKKGNSIISELLDEKIKDRLCKNEQIILLLNRRGFSSYIMCSNCGYTYKCKNCDITLTYHKTSNNLQCHYCGYTVFKSNLCPECNEDSLNYYGLGTEKLEEYLISKYDKARILRMDFDTTTKKGSHEKMIKAFQNHEYDILLGTQMISKGLDFPLVSLVGVINSDASLNIPDFRSGEKTFALLDQVAGRAGRKDLIGEVVFQTYNPDNYIINCAINHDYNNFYNYEMHIRKELSYPPYCFITSIKFASREYDLCGKEANKAYAFLKKNLDSSVRILGPSACQLFRFNNIYRFQIILKYKDINLINNALIELQNIFNSNKMVNVEIDNNPLKI